MRLFIPLVMFCLIFNYSYAQEPVKEPIKVEGEDGGSFPTYEPRGREKIPVKEKLLNFGAVYVFQWAFYLYSQEEEIRENGSWKKWYQDSLSPRFDKDSFEYNIFKHTLTGNYYYLFYRSRNYSEKDAFFWSFMSSLAFEFAIETATEKPSYQDIYQTPVFGAVLGIGSEKLSNYLHAKNTWYWHTLGYIVNPMTLIPQFAREKKVAAMPLIDKNKVGALVTWGF